MHKGLRLEAITGWVRMLIAEDAMYEKPSYHHDQSRYSGFGVISKPLSLKIVCYCIEWCNLKLYYSEKDLYMNCVKMSPSCIETSSSLTNSGHIQESDESRLFGFDWPACGPNLFLTGNKEHNEKESDNNANGCWAAENLYLARLDKELSGKTNCSKCKVGQARQDS